MRVSIARVRMVAFLIFVATVFFVGPSAVQANMFNSYEIWTEDCIEDDCSSGQRDQCDSDCISWCQTASECGELGLTLCDPFGEPCYAHCVCYFTPSGSPEA